MLNEFYQILAIIDVWGNKYLDMRAMLCYILINVELIDFVTIYSVGKIFLSEERKVFSQ